VNLLWFSHLLGWILLIFQFNASAATTTRKVPLDVHLHYDLYSAPTAKSGNNAEDLKAVLNSKQFGRALLISPGYLQSRIFDHEKQEWRDYRKEFDLRTSQIVQQHPESFLGLCGGNLESEDGEEVVRSCLKLTGMIGLKLREPTHALADPVHFSKLESILNSNPSLKVVLIHPISLLQEKDFKAEAEAYLKISAKFPDVQIIVAHSGYSPKFIEALALTPARKRSNLFLDTSTALNHHGYSDNELVVAYRKFGMSNVVYGSDFSIGGTPPRRENYQDYYSDVEKSKVFAEDEIDKILFQNPQRLLNKIIPESPLGNTRKSGVK
jgi:predicted TIM-barrel fold metal-dependent hydrolase